MALARRFEGEQSLDYVDSEQELDFSLTMSGHGREAEPFARDVLRHYRAKYGDKNLLAVPHGSAWPKRFASQGSFSEAEPALLSVYETVKDGRGVAASVRGYAANASRGSTTPRAARPGCEVSRAGDAAGAEEIDCPTTHSIPEASRYMAA